MADNLWWGYRHITGNILIKRYFSNQGITEAQQSEFCEKVTGPVSARDRDDAESKIFVLLGNKQE